MKSIVKRFGAGIVVGALLMGSVSCSSNSIHPKKFRDMLLEETSAVEYDFSEFKKMDDESMFSDGVVIYEDEDIAKYSGEFDKKISQDSRSVYAMSHYEYSSEDMKDYDIKDAVFYFANTDEGDDNDCFTAAKYIRFDNREQAQASFEDYCDRISTAWDFKLSKMDESYYSLDDYEGYFIVTMNQEVVTGLINSYFDYVRKAYGGEMAGVRESYLDLYGDGFEITMVTYLKGRTITSAICWDYKGGEVFEPIVDFLGMSDPFEVDNGMDIYHSIDNAGFGEYIVKIEEE